MLVFLDISAKITVRSREALKYHSPFDRVVGWWNANATEIKASRASAEWYLFKSCCTNVKYRSNRQCVIVHAMHTLSLNTIKDPTWWFAH